MKNNLSDLNNHLFSMLELLDNDEEMADEKALSNALNRAKAMSAVASQIIGVARTQLDALKVAKECGVLNKDMPALIEIRDSRTMLVAPEAK